MAATHGHVQVVRSLLEAGGRINKADDDGVTPLHLAAQHGRAEVVHCLLQNGADMNKARTSNGDTPHGKT